MGRRLSPPNKPFYSLKDHNFAKKIWELIFKAKASAATSRKQSKEIVSLTRYLKYSKKKIRKPDDSARHHY